MTLADSPEEPSKGQDGDKQLPVETPEDVHESYSVFTINEKRAIVTTGSLASFFSPLSSSIYFPALDTIATALNVSIVKINLTVTTYLVSHNTCPQLTGLSKIFTC